MSPLPDPGIWKQEVSARVQAYRSRRQPAQSSLPGIEPSRRTPRISNVAATVAERYAAAPSYSEYLAKLSAPPETASVSQFETYSSDFQTHGSSALDMFQSEPEAGIAIVEAAEPTLVEEAVSAPITSSVIEPAAEASTSELRVTEATDANVQAQSNFLAQSTVEPDIPIATKLIEFPRQIIAARRARPRLAEGPLRENAKPLTPEETSPQLRIFEVEEERISREPLAADPSAPAQEWRYIQLHTPLLSAPVPATAAASERLVTPLEVAPLNRRLMAAALDLGLVTLGFLIFAAGFIAVASHPPSDVFAMVSAGIVFAALAIGYQWLFFSLSDATPGMRYARIALCTFKDENPTVRARRNRVMATFLAAGAAGLGFFWVWFDPDNLGWHDRISRTYQRCY